MSLLFEISSVIKESPLERIKMVVMVIAMISAIGISVYQKYEEDYLKNENQTYEAQVETLAEVQSSINNLSEFVRLQKEQLKQSQQTVESLKNEQEKLKPVVEADRQVVESILALQSQRARANVWQERLIGFGLGIVGSLLASLIWAGIRRGRNA